MNKEAHPNIQAVGLTIDIVKSIEKRLRGKGGEQKKKVMSDESISNEIANFVVCISCKIDNIVEDDGGEINGDK